MADGVVVLALFSADGYALPVLLSVDRARAVGQALVDAATAVEAFQGGARWD